MGRKTYVVLLVVAILALTALPGRVLAAPAVQGAPIEVVAVGLDNPRGLVFGPDGALYVAEAGKDSFIDGTQPNTVFGAASTMWSGYADNMRPVVQADIPVCDDKYTCITPNATVDQAYLYVFVAEGRGFPAWSDSVIDVSAHAVQTSWDETATWNSPWANPGGDFGPALDTIKVGSGRIGTWWRFDVTKAVADIVAGLVANNGFVLTSQYNVPPKEMAAWASARYGLATQGYWDPGKAAYLRVIYRTFE